MFLLSKKRIAILFVLALFIAPGILYAPPPGGSLPPTQCSEEDGDPSGVCLKFVFANGDLSFSGTTAHISDSTSVGGGNSVYVTSGGTAVFNNASADMTINTSADILWSGSGQTRTMGINWPNVKSGELQAAGINWSSLSEVIQSSGINWTDVYSGELQKSGINWSSLSEDIQTAGINWDSVASATIQAVLGSVYEPAGVAVADITDASANGRSLISAADFAAMRGLLDLEAGTDIEYPLTFNQPLTRSTNTIGFNWPTSAEIQAAGINWTDVNVLQKLTKGGINWTTIPQVIATFTIDGAGAAFTTGFKASVTIPFAATLTGWDLLLDASDTVVLDVWLDDLANHPLADANSITNSHEPQTSAASYATDADISDWSDVTISAGQEIGFNVDTAPTGSGTKATLVLKGYRT